MPTPRSAGFYWAKWLTADDGTKEGTLLTPEEGWDVVFVFENSFDPSDERRFRVLVVGVEGTQSIENFEWGRGPLVPPRDTMHSRSHAQNEARNSS